MSVPEPTREEWAARIAADTTASEPRCDLCHEPACYEELLQPYPKGRWVAKPLVARKLCRSCAVSRYHLP